MITRKLPTTGNKPVSRSLGAIMAAAVVGAAFIAASALPAAGAAELIEATPSTTVIEAPGPGHSQSWQVTVRNATSQPQPVTLTIGGESDRLFSGASPMYVELVDESGNVVVAGEAPEVLGATIDLAPFDAQDVRAYTARVELPRTAGNEYQGASGTLDLSFVASAEPEPEPDDTLAQTGGASSGLLTLAGAALVLFALGAALTARRRKELA